MLGRKSGVSDVFANVEKVKTRATGCCIGRYTNAPECPPRSHHHSPGLQFSAVAAVCTMQHHIAHICAISGFKIVEYGNQTGSIRANYEHFTMKLWDQ